MPSRTVTSGPLPPACAAPPGPPLNWKPWLIQPYSGGTTTGGCRAGLALRRPGGRNPLAVHGSKQRKTASSRAASCGGVSRNRRAKTVSRILLSDEPAGFDLENPHADDHADAPLIHLADVHEPPISLRPVDDPTPRGRHGFDAGAGARLRSRLAAGRHA